MLTKEKEGNRVRCYHYWPDETDMYGQMKVVLVNENEYSGYIQRDFKLIDTKVGGRGSCDAGICSYLPFTCSCMHSVCMGIGYDLVVVMRVRFGWQ